MTFGEEFARRNRAHIDLLKETKKNEISFLTLDADRSCEAKALEEVLLHGQEFSAIDNLLKSSGAESAAGMAEWLGYFTLASEYVTGDVFRSVNEDKQNLESLQFKLQASLRAAQKSISQEPPKTDDPIVYLRRFVQHGKAFLVGQPNNGLYEATYRNQDQKLTVLYRVEGRSKLGDRCFDGFDPLKHNSQDILRRNFGETLGLNKGLLLRIDLDQGDKMEGVALEILSNGYGRLYNHTTSELEGLSSIDYLVDKFLTRIVLNQETECIQEVHKVTPDLPQFYVPKYSSPMDHLAHLAAHLRLKGYVCTYENGTQRSTGLVHSLGKMEIGEQQVLKREGKTFENTLTVEHPQPHQYVIRIECNGYGTTIQEFSIEQEGERYIATRETIEGFIISRGDPASNYLDDFRPLLHKMLEEFANRYQHRRIQDHVYENLDRKVEETNNLVNKLTTFEQLKQTYLSLESKPTEDPLEYLHSFMRTFAPVCKPNTLGAEQWLCRQHKYYQESDNGSREFLIDVNLHLNRGGNEVHFSRQDFTKKALSTISAGRGSATYARDIMLTISESDKNGALLEGSDETIGTDWKPEAFRGVIDHYINLFVYGSEGAKRVEELTAVEQMETLVETAVNSFFPGVEGDLLREQINKQKAILKSRGQYASIPRLCLGPTELPTPGQNDVTKDQYTIQGAQVLVSYLTALQISDANEAEEIVARKLVNTMMPDFQRSSERAEAVIYSIHTPLKEVKYG